MKTDQIKAILEEFLNKLCIVYESIDVKESLIKNKPCLIIRTKDSKLLIGNHGANLSALNLIIKQLVRKQTDNSVNNHEDKLKKQPDFLVDVNNYYTKRIEDVIYQAELTAERAKLFKRNIDLQPMSAYERLIVHSHFANDDTIETESQGEGKFRRITIKFLSEIRL